MELLLYLIVKLLRVDAFLGQIDTVWIEGLKITLSKCCLYVIKMELIAHTMFSWTFKLIER